MWVRSEDMEQLQCKESDWSWTVDEPGVLMAPTCLESPCDVCPNPSSPFCQESGTYCPFPSFLLNPALHSNGAAFNYTFYNLQFYWKIPSELFKWQHRIIFTIIWSRFGHVTGHFPAVREPDVSGSLFFNSTKINKRNPWISNFLRTFL